MPLFLWLFDVSVPLRALVLIVAFVFMVSCSTSYASKGRRFYHMIIWIIAYLFLMLCSTVIGRTSQVGMPIHLSLSGVLKQ